MGKVPRVRTKGGYTKTTGTVSEWISDPYPWANPYLYPANGLQPSKKIENMWDTIGFEGCDFNPCWHEKGLLSDNTPLVDEPRPDGFGLPPTHRKWAGTGHYADSILAGRSIPLDLAEWLDDFAAKANYHFITAVEPVGSLINFLIEAVELCELNIRVLQDLWKGITKALKTFWSMFAKTGDFWLSWNFAIKPTIGDIRNMLDTLKKAQKRLKWLRERNHKNTKIKYREGPREFEGTAMVPHLRPTVDRVNMIYPDLDAGGDDQYEEGFDSEPDSSVDLEVAYKATVTLTSWAWVRFDIDDAYLDSEYGLGIVSMVMQGLYDPAGIIWEATPFSWLIDWFRTQKDLLQQQIDLSLSPLKDGTILSVGWAIKVEIHGDMTWVRNKDYDNYRSDAGAMLYRLYSRSPGLPDAESSPFRVPLKWYNLSIILALLAQFKRRN